jgi:2,4-diketo-3-deoxy-L-fuconate hydrolase
MKLLRLGAIGAERPAVLLDAAEGGGVRDLSGLTTDIDGAFLAADGIARVAAAVAAGSLPEIEDPGDGTGLRLGSPVARPAAVICIGQNYAAHAAESGSPPPPNPIVFLKHPNTVVGPYDDIAIPRGAGGTGWAEQTDWEVELGVVIGRELSYADSEADALAHVAGYVTIDDVSERYFQRDVSGGQWSKGKCAPTFAPVGPWLVPAADVPDPQALTLRSWVGGEPRQDSTTADMIFGVGFLLHSLSQFMTLSAGDIVATGTPEGVAMSGRFPYLKAGDTLEIEVAGLGRQRNTLVAG